MSSDSALSDVLLCRESPLAPETMRKVARAGPVSSDAAFEAEQNLMFENQALAIARALGLRPPSNFEEAVQWCIQTRLIGSGQVNITFPESIPSFVRDHLLQPILDSGDGPDLGYMSMFVPLGVGMDCISETRLGQGTYGRVFRHLAHPSAIKVQCIHGTEIDRKDFKGILPQQACNLLSNLEIVFPYIGHNYGHRGFAAIAMPTWWIVGNTLCGEMDLAIGNIETMMNEFKDTGYTKSARNIYTWAVDIFSAIEYLQSIGVVHADVKQMNCLVSMDGRCRLADFGLSLAFPPGVEEVMADNFGTCSFRPPYHTYRNGDQDPMVRIGDDVYSAALMFTYVASFLVYGSEFGVFPEAENVQSYPDAQDAINHMHHRIGSQIAIMVWQMEWPEVLLPLRDVLHDIFHKRRSLRCGKTIVDRLLASH
jgi:hypothetical protein